MDLTASFIPGTINRKQSFQSPGNLAISMQSFTLTSVHLQTASLYQCRTFPNSCFILFCKFKNKSPVSLSGESQNSIGPQPNVSIHSGSEVDPQEWKSWIGHGIYICRAQVFFVIVEQKIFTTEWYYSWAQITACHDCQTIRVETGAGEDILCLYSLGKHAMHSLICRKKSN